MTKLFGSSGVRGLVNSFLTPKLACQVGMAVATQSKAKKAVLGCDTRTSGQMLEDSIVAGLTAVGTDVFLLGTVPTPTVAYLTRVLKADVGLMLTASHNPPQYNGIKVFRNDSLSYTFDAQNSVQKIVEENNYSLTDWRAVGSAHPVDAANIYIEMLLNAASIAKKWHVVIDTGCGATFQVAPETLSRLGCKTTVLNAHPDGFFPARNSEPTAESIDAVTKLVKEMRADLGVAFDGDGDRVAFVDDRGEFVDFDQVLAAFSAYVLRKKKGGTIVTNVEASMCVETMAEKYGGKVMRAPVGDIYISEAIKRYDAVFGGEPCGAWVHPQWHWCPDGPLSAALLISALENENKTLSEFIAEVPKYVTLREKIKCNNDSKQEIVSQIKETIKNEFPDHSDFSIIDGIRLSLKNGWILIRASGTEPIVRITVEGESLKVAQDIMDAGVALIRKHVGAT